MRDFQGGGVGRNEVSAYRSAGLTELRHVVFGFMSLSVKLLQLARDGRVVSCQRALLRAKQCLNSSVVDAITFVTMTAVGCTVPILPFDCDAL